MTEVKDTALTSTIEPERVRGGRGMDGRQLLSTAKGIVMALRGCSDSAAFDELLRVARRCHISVLNAARALVDFAIGDSPPLGSSARPGGVAAVWAEWESCCLAHRLPTPDHPL